MSLDSSPLSPRPTPLLNPTDPVPGRRAALIGGGISVVLAAVIVFVTLRLGTQIIFLPTGINASANAVVDQLQQIQGFSDYWTRSYDVNGFRGYNDDSANGKILTDEASNYHMNLAVITITANMVTYSGTSIIDNHNDPNDIDTYADSVYTKMVNEVRAAGLTPVFRLDVRVTQDAQNGNYTSTTIGNQWTNQQAVSFYDERAWFNSYTNFAVHYATLAQSLNIPLFIIGGDLSFIATDTPFTGLSAKKRADPSLDGDLGTKCYGRRDCEWRHVIDAIHNGSYKPLGAKHSMPGGNYGGRLSFAAIVHTDSSGNSFLTTPEWSTITFWDALDVIGIDAYFPLTNNLTEPSVAQLNQSWKGELPAAQSANNTPVNVVDQLEKLSNQYGKRILFTAAGYESVGGCTSDPGGDTTGTVQDDIEQQNDMTALINVFAAQTWWVGVIWSSDYPVWPRANLMQASSVNNARLTEPDYQTNTEWAGKGGGDALKQLYSATPLTDALWANL